MVNYTNSKIYKIFSNNSTKIYVGSTTKPYLHIRRDTINPYNKERIDRETDEIIALPDWFWRTKKMEMMDRRSLIKQKKKQAVILAAQKRYQMPTGRLLPVKSNK